jgi:hypothetical protein
MYLRLVRCRGTLRGDFRDVVEAEAGGSRRQQQHRGGKQRGKRQDPTPAFVSASNRHRTARYHARRPVAKSYRRR